MKNLQLPHSSKTEETIHLPYVAFHGNKRIQSPEPAKMKKGGLLLTFDANKVLRNAFYVSEIGWNSFAFKMFIRGKHSNAFENIYTDNSEGKNRPPEVQIWKINYPEHIKPHPKYIATE